MLASQLERLRLCSKERRVFAVAMSLIVIASLDAAECVDEPVDNRWITCLCLGVT
jgi:hypothetical protein